MATAGNESKAPCIPECEVFYEGGPDSKQKYSSCDKYPDHKDFIPIKEFKMEHFPPPARSVTAVNKIKLWADKTVKVIVTYISLDRPDTFANGAPYPYRDLKGSTRASRCGTGFVNALTTEVILDKKCPCRDCKKSDNPKESFIVTDVFTSAHVIFDNSEAERSVFELFYDSDEDRSSVRFLYGVKLSCRAVYTTRRKVENNVSKVQKAFTDFVQIRCVTHEMDLLSTLEDTDYLVDVNVPRLPVTVLISHPHGRSKQVTIGNCLHRRVLIPPEFYSKGIMFKSGKVFSRQIWNWRRDDHFASVKNGLRKRGEYYYELTEPMALRLPESATYLCQFYRDYSGVAHVHPDAMLVNNDGTMKINISKFDVYIRDLRCDGHSSLDYTADNGMPYCLAYDAPTCNGSSGAPVIYCELGLNYIGHQGSTDAGKKPIGLSCLTDDTRQKYIYRV